MAKEKKYNVLAETSQSNLVKAVNEQIAGGWKPNGGVSIAVQDGKTMFFQAITWQAKEPKIKKAVL